MSLLRPCMVVCLMVLTSTAGAVDAAERLDVRLERDLTPRLQASDLFAFFKVVLTDAHSGLPPTEDYSVFALATNRTGDKTMPFACGHLVDNDPSAVRGVYTCTVIVDHGGVWTAVAVVNQTGAGGVPVERARAELPFEINTDTVYRGDVGAAKVQGDGGKVALLWAHSAAAAGWLGCVAMLTLLGLPAARRQLADRALHGLERRLEFLVKAAAIAAVATVGSGLYLMLNETAYDTPWSASEVDAVFALPFGKPYFLALGAKLAFYALMLLAAISLARSAREHLHLGVAGPATEARSGRPDDRSPWEAVRSAPRSGGQVLTEAPVIEAPAPTGGPNTTRQHGAIAAIVATVATVGIWVCITLLKYFHQLIEASLALN